MPLAQPTAAASATSCKVSNDSSPGTVIDDFPQWATSRVAQCLGYPARRALVEERRHAFPAFRRDAHSRAPNSGIRDHNVIDGTCGDGSYQCLRLRLRARAGDEQRAQELVDPPVDLVPRTDVVHEPDAERLRRGELL